MKKTITIKSSREFTAAFRRGKPSGDKLLVAYVIPNRSAINKIGISIGKKIGNSVCRNRVKRLIRESYRQIEKNIKTGFNIVFLPREESKNASYIEVLKSMIKTLKKHNLFIEDVI